MTANSTKRGSLTAGLTALMVMLAVVPSRAEPQLSLSSAGAVLGGTATITLRLDDASELCGGVNGKLSLPAGVQLADVVSGDLLSDAFTVVSHALAETADNTYTFAAYSTLDAFSADSGALLVLTLNVSEVAEEVGLDEDPVLFGELLLLNSGLATGDGQVSLSHSTVGGRLVLMREAAPVLDVAPLTHEVGAAGGDVTFAVANVGFLDMTWSATAGPVDWLTITAGATGINGGAVTVRCAANPGSTTRTAEVTVDAGAVPGSPVVASIVQQGDATPHLSVTPMSHEVPSTSGLCSLEVVNSGYGTMPWAARVVAGLDWLAIDSGESGTDAGTITLLHDPNTTAASRSATVEVTAPGALDSPALVTITQQTSTGPLLVVSPPERTVPASAGTASFNVRNAGGGAMAWTAAVSEGSGWLTIESGTAGMQDGTIEVAFTRNTMLESRIGTIHVEAEGAGESPVDVTVVQRERQLLVIASPNGGEHFARGEVVTIAWTSDSESTEAVSLVLVKGGGVHSTIAVTADNSGTYPWTVPRLLEPGDDYTIQIIDVANAAIHDESDAAFSVACPPEAPQHVTASDDRADMVMVTWDAVDSAESYRVYRQIMGDTAGPELLGATDATNFEDTTALAPEKGGTSCHPQMTIHHYLYSVSAVNVCAEGVPSEADEGCRIESTEKSIYEHVLPSAPVVDGVIMIQPDAAIAIRVRSASAIDVDGIAASIVWNSGSSQAAQWVPVSEQDGWAVYRPEQTWQVGDSITMTVQARTVTGEALGPFEHHFEVTVAANEVETLWQPEYTDLEPSAIDRTKEGNEQVTLMMAGPEDDAETGLGAFVIGPLEPYDMPQRVWLPLPESTSGEMVRAEYYHGLDSNAGWYAADEVEGWMIPGSELEVTLDGTDYLGILVRHGGVVRLVANEAHADGYEHAAIPRTPEAADIFVVAMLLAILGLAGYRIRRSPEGAAPSMKRGS